MPETEWCHARHICHHWFERECSDECDRGEHAYPHNHEGCTTAGPLAGIPKSGDSDA